MVNSYDSFIAVFLFNSCFMYLFRLEMCEHVCIWDMQNLNYWKIYESQRMNGHKVSLSDRWVGRWPLWAVDNLENPEPCTW